MLPRKQESVLNREISFFNSGQDTEPQKANLLDLLLTDKYKSQVETIRKIDDSKERSAAKLKMPAFTPSGLFFKRNAEGLIKHSGFIALDIDQKDNQDIDNFEDLKKQLINIPCIAYIGRSVSGKGYWCLIPIQFPDKHREHFLALEKIFKDLEITIDPSCKDVSRLRFCSWDEEAYFNHGAKTFYITATLPAPSTQRVKRSFRPSTDVGKDVEQCIIKIERTGRDITDGYRHWFEIGCSLSNTFGEAGREYFHRVSEKNSQYDYQDADRQFTKCLKSDYSYTIGTFFHHCKQAGITI